MSIFSRIFKVGQAHANKVVDKFEKPEVMLEQAIRDKDEQIRDAKRSIRDLIATERATKAQLEREKAEKLGWEQKAQAALKSGREELAVKALQRASEHEQKAAALQTNWSSQAEGVEGLKREIRKMEEELSEFKRNKDFIIAQSKTAEVKKSIYEAKAKMGKRRSADDLMERMKAKAERAGYEAEAAQDMAETFGGGDSLEKEFEQLGTSGVSPDVQDKLAAMKAKLGQTSS